MSFELVTGHSTDMINFVEALGLGGRAIKKIVITMEIDNVVMIETEEYVEKTALNSLINQFRWEGKTTTQKYRLEKWTDDLLASTN